MLSNNKIRKMQTHPLVRKDLCDPFGNPLDTDENAVWQITNPDSYEEYFANRSLESAIDFKDELSNAIRCLIEIKNAVYDDIEELSKERQ